MLPRESGAAVGSHLYAWSSQAARRWSIGVKRTPWHTVELPLPRWNLVASALLLQTFHSRTRSVCDEYAMTHSSLCMRSIQISLDGAINGSRMYDATWARAELNLMTRAEPD